MVPILTVVWKEVLGLHLFSHHLSSRGALPGLTAGCGQDICFKMSLCTYLTISRLTKEGSVFRSSISSLTDI